MTTVNTEIPNRERLIFALDVPNLEEAQALISTLGDSVVFYKLGLEVFLSGHYFELLAELKGQGKKIFAAVPSHELAFPPRPVQMKSHLFAI